MRLPWSRRCLSAYQVRWHESPDNLGMADAAQGTFYRESDLRSLDGYVDWLYGVGVSYDSAIHSHLVMIAHRDLDEVAANAVILVARADELQTTLSGVLGIDNDRTLVRSLQKAIADYRSLLRREFTKVRPGVGVDQSQLAELVGRCDAIRDAWRDDSEQFRRRHENSDTGSFATSLADFLDDVAWVGIDLSLQAGGPVHSFFYYDTYDGGDWEQYEGLVGDEVRTRQQALREAEAKLAKLLGSGQSPPFAAIAHTEVRAHRGQPEQVLMVRSYEWGVSHGNLTYRPYRIGRKVVDIVDRPVFVKLIPNLLPAFGSADDE